MTARRIIRRITALACLIILSSVGCGFKGVNSLPLPGAVGRGSGATIYHVEIANVGSLESNSPVLVNDVVVGSVGTMTLRNWHADVQVSIRPGVVIAGNAVAAVGQTSLLGSMHISLDPPLGSQPEGRLQPGGTIPLSRTHSYPSTEQTLSSLSTVVNAGGLGQIGDIVRSLNGAFNGRQGAARDLLGRLDDFVGVFDAQRADVIDAITALNRLSGTLNDQRGVLSAALRDIPPALDVLVQERPRITTALEELGTFGNTASTLVQDAGGDLVATLKNLGPTVGAVADVGPQLGRVVAALPIFPFSQNLVDRGVRGDYMNLYVIVDLTTARLKRTLLAGTRFENQTAQLVPAPGDLGYDAYYTRNPLGAPVQPAPASPNEALRPQDLPAPASNPAQSPPLSADVPGTPGGLPGPAQQTDPSPVPAGGR